MELAPDYEKDYAALNELVVNCPELTELERLLGGFNLFQVLKFEHGEIRHSNVLAWLLSPEESHGLGDAFLQSWLMRVLHEAPTAVGLAPIDVDTWDLADVEVRREWKNIDLLLILTMRDGERWVVCIENKINSKQHSNQLKRYRSIVEASFCDCSQKLYVFLTKNRELPEDANYLEASYEQVHTSLSAVVSARSFSIGDEPRVLINNYLRLIEEKFMNESDIARLARKILKQHKRALDVINAHRPENLKLAAEPIRQLVEANAERLDLVMGHCTDSYVRFIPKAWDQAGNRHGSNWGQSTHSISLEINLSGKDSVYFVIVAANCPDEWIDPLWKRAHEKPFKRVIRMPKERPKQWVRLYSEKLKVSAEDDVEIDSDAIAQQIFDWVDKRLADASVKSMVEIVAERLPDLDRCYQS